MFGLGTGEMLIILIVILLVFGGSRLPELGKGLGQGMRSFRDALKGIDKPEDAPVPQTEAKPAEVEPAKKS